MKPEAPAVTPNGVDYAEKLGGDGVANDVATPDPPDPPPTLTVDRAPDKPSLVGVETHNMVVQWSPVCITTQSSGIRVVGYLSTYVLEMRRASVGEAAGGWTVQYEGTATYVNINGLRAGRSYEVRVTCKPVPTDPDVVVVAAPPSEILQVDTPAAPPGAPALRLANRQARELEFKWQAPADDGGRPIRQYVFECSPPPQGRELPHSAEREGMYELYRGDERSVVMKPVLPGHIYTVRVKAINEIGEGPFTPLQDFATQTAAPSAPAAPAVVSCGYDSVRLQWPASAGNGAEVTGYFMEMDDGSGSGFVFVGHCSEPNFSMAGLRGGVTYRFRVRAQNAKTLSTWSPVCEARTAPTPPLPPIIVTTASTHASVRISWQPPEHDGGSPVTEYQVEAEPLCRGAKLDCPDEAMLVYQGPDTTCALGGLRPGCTYLVSVRAVNAQGRGERSVPVSVLTASACPELPGAPTAPVRYQTSVAVAWPPSPHDGGSPITAYRLQGRLIGWLEGTKGKSSTEGPSWEELYTGLECRATIDELEIGARYEFRVAAVNKHGSSGWTPAVSVDTKPGLPLPPAPPLFSLTPVLGSVHLAWQPPYGQGAPVNSYVVQICTQRALAQAVAALAPTAGAGLHAANGAAPLNEDAAVGSAESSGQTEMDSAFEAVYHGGDTNCTVSGLEPDTDYAFRVKACSSAGAGSWGEVAVYRTPPAPPSAPQGLHAVETDAGPNQIRLEWQPPACDYGSPVTSFQLDYAPVGRGQRTAGPLWKTGFQGAEESCVVAGLRPGKEYAVRVRASNACGWGPWGPSATTATRPDVPDAPAAPAFSHRTATAVRIKWDPPLEDRGAAVIRHELQMAKGSDGQFARVSYAEGTTFKAQQLDPGTRYSFRVRAFNAVGSGPWSAAASVTTGLAPPLAPTAVQATPDAAAAALKVAWQPSQLTALHAACISYELEAVPSNSQRLSPERGSPYRPAAHVVKQTCSGKVAEHRLSGLQVGCEYKVHLRCIGADGAGHGEWSTPVTVLMPAMEQNGASTVAPIAHLAVADSVDGKIRRGRKASTGSEAAGGDPASVSEDDAGGKTQRAGTSGIKAASVVKAAKSQPRQKRWWSRVAKWLGISEASLKTIVFLFLAAVLLGAVLHLLA